MSRTSRRREPHVTPGAYEVTGGGWKLFEKKSDAESHINGVEYTPTADPLYWYQHGYYLAYYAKTYLGETYSNTVQVSVANYHDLKKVLDDANHYYVDNPTVKRNSKIYINDATNGATQLKQFFDLTVPTGSPATAVLDEHVRDCQYLEFILHTNVNHTGDWTSIGDATNCFAGNLHGDGYHIDGLDHSLFGHLCGNVYNLGVTGSFAGAGIADTGDGYVENCWISTTGTPDGTVHAVFGNPTASGYKRVNCYYPNTLTYDTSDDSHGLARPMPASAFYNGTVAYDLNGFYLFKRYNDKKTTSGTQYQYYTINTDGTLSEPQTQHYATNAEYCSSGYKTVYANGGYVEDRYGDGDFRYADGVIPETEDQRAFVDADDYLHFYPIWPDDYLYFGQMLTYNWNNQRPHQNVPSHIVKNSGRLPATDESNCLYRAPAYYQSKQMDVAHFNPVVNLVAYSKPKNPNDTDLSPAYPNMTAIDFAGHNDTGYKPGLNGDYFYQPLLDDDGLLSITNRDETNNLLVYAPSETASEGYANKKTYDVLTAYFTDPSYADSYHESPYRCVDISAGASTVNGHLVQSNLTATSDHLLIDKQDFNCPISYTFANGKRMWYQRVPDNYVSLTKGWSTVSLPFTAELVSTQDKGEITHFYSESPSVDANDTKVGHEYWLSEYQGIETSSSPIGALTASFSYPTATGVNKQVDNKQVNNTFLWDYYYSKNVQHDANADTYQTRYQQGRTLMGYPLLAAAQPYMIGFPGKTFYEFDLSGEWKVRNTATTAPEQLGKQTISFVSKPGITIAVSDDELTASAINGYKFMPNYMSKKVEGYLMNSDGNSFDMTMSTTEPATPVAVAAVPFRPYFVAAPSSGARERTRSIVFNMDGTGFDFYGDEKPIDDELGEGTLEIYTQGQSIAVTSTLREAVPVQIYAAGGILIATFDIQPNETVKTPTGSQGVYIVRADGGRYTKKLGVK